MTLFIHVRILDIIDILLVAYLLYFIYHLIKGSVAINIFIGIIAIYFLYRLVSAYQMEMLGEILGQFISVGVIALIIVFQQELRQFLFLLGRAKMFSKGIKAKNILLGKFNIVQDKILDLPPIIESIRKMSNSLTGALIVITQKNDLLYFVKTGELINSDISCLLIESIFYKNSPLHDGAIIISHNRIKSAKCVLPLIDDSDFPEDLGLRHRAAAGITSNTDAIAIVVSEQTGKIAFSMYGKVFRNLSPDEVKTKLEEVFIQQPISNL
ncbi:MAG: diadenylate cyclase CdaA [Bacteroidales bacterium]|nr:diadenylate cyclase CdaA [Bacteroidales bacterium]